MLSSVQMGVGRMRKRRDFLVNADPGQGLCCMLFV